jgi:serine phosphatase RsbU (regulator of sigma subunit)
MKFRITSRFTVGRRISLGFGALIFLTLIAFGFTLLTINSSRKSNERIAKSYTPSLDALQEMRLMVTRSRNYITSWLKVEMFSYDKERLRLLINSEYPELEKKIAALSIDWTKEDRILIDTIFSKCHALWNVHGDVMTALNTQEKYSDATVMFLVEPKVLDDDDDVQRLTREISEKLDHLIGAQDKAVSQKRIEMMESFRRLQIFVLILFILLPIGGIIIAIFTTNSITRPVKSLKSMLNQMAKGILPQNTIRKRNDEIGEMAMALDSLVKSLKRTSEFAQEVGSGNFESHFKPLSDQDTMGHALIRMRSDLKENERVLEAKVIERTEEVVRQKEEIEVQNKKLEILYKHVTDSIRYAKRLQDAILPPPAVVNRLLPDSFILFKPKDIVSGDFYWMYEKAGKIIIAAVDCTGHGVPGAFMSIVGNNMLKQIMRERELHEAGAILDRLNKLAGKNINQNADDSAVRDGMDLSLCVLDPATRKLEMAGANNPMYLFRKGALLEFKADKMPIGYIDDSTQVKNFTTHTVQLEPGDTIYLFSDGYADQFGGPRGKKFMIGQFRNLLKQIHNKPMAEQKRLMDNTIEQWRGNLEQVDDILVMGFRVNS